MLNLSVQRGGLLRWPVALETLCTILPLSKGKFSQSLAVGNYSMGEGEQYFSGLQQDGEQPE